MHTVVKKNEEHTSSTTPVNWGVRANERAAGGRPQAEATRGSHPPVKEHPYTTLPNQQHCEQTEYVALAYD
uniref:Uncharacterized protein n=1 Tax=Oryza punctata TaxID=4537 RepID=A0A0E0KBX3_ORYPU